MVRRLWLIVGSEKPCKLGQLEHQRQPVQYLYRWHGEAALDATEVSRSMSAFRAVPRSPHPRASRTPRSGIWVEAAIDPNNRKAHKRKACICTRTDFFFTRTWCHSRGSRVNHLED
jgi:imidazolonepropionase-like amidohydrolase